MVRVLLLDAALELSICPGGTLLQFGYYRRGVGVAMQPKQGEREREREREEEKREARVNSTGKQKLIY